MNSNGGAQARSIHPCTAPGSSPEPDYDVIVVGSGFGGSVAALRLVEKGYRVAVLEAGRRFADTDFPKTTWDLRRYLFAPRLGCFGIQRINVLRDVIVLGGGGSEAVRSSSATRSTGRAPTPSTATRSGPGSPTGAPSSTRITTPPPACSA